MIFQFSFSLFILFELGVQTECVQNDPASLGSLFVDPKFSPYNPIATLRQVKVLSKTL